MEDYPYFYKMGEITEMIEVRDNGGAGHEKIYVSQRRSNNFSEVSFDETDGRKLQLLKGSAVEVNANNLSSFLKMTESSRQRTFMNDSNLRGRNGPHHQHPQAQRRTSEEARKRSAPTRPISRDGRKLKGKTFLQNTICAKYSVKH